MMQCKKRLKIDYGFHSKTTYDTLNRIKVYMIHRKRHGEVGRLVHVNFIQNAGGSIASSSAHLPDARGT